jgi:6-phosphofructokinase 1
MNAAIRAIVRAGIYHGMTVVGVEKGYEGMINGQMRILRSNDVANIIQRGGTILRSARSKGFRTPEGRKQAYENLIKFDVDALVVIGGDGSFMGAGIFSREFDIPCVGIPGTIDNDMYGTDYTIGFDTALNTIVDTVDKIKDTASSHDRMFFVEVMGRGAGFLALQSGIAVGAEAVFIPETSGISQGQSLRDYLDNERNNKAKNSHIILVAEGNDLGNANKIAEMVQTEYPEFDVRANVLGHMQRGGSPSAFDRFLASRLGVEAVEALLDNQRSIMVGYQNHEVVHVPFNKTIKLTRSVSNRLLEIATILNT